jgi:Alginate export
MALGQSPNRLHINAQAMAFEGGLTFEQLPWAPRVGVEFNYASGDGNANSCNGQTGVGCGGNANTFENL